MNMCAKPIRNAFDAYLTPQVLGTEMANARYLPIESIQVNPHQARQQFDEEALDELRHSIEEQGVLQPIGVRKLADGFEIVYGERRYRAAVLAGLINMPCIVYENLDDTQAALVTAMENLQREDLDPEDEANQFARLLAVTGLSQRDLAERLGKSHNYISRRVRLLAEWPEAFAAIRDGRITFEEALAQLAQGHREILYRDDTILPTVEPKPDLTPRTEMLDPVRAGQVAAVFKPVARFERYIQQLQPATVPPEDRPALRERLENVVTAAQVALRALSEADAS
jgi:ParB/RepB/Spo0J family partition protein